jgi:hypothetical protein
MHFADPLYGTRDRAELPPMCVYPTCNFVLQSGRINMQAVVLPRAADHGRGITPHRIGTALRLAAVVETSVA